MLPIYILLHISVNGKDKRAKPGKFPQSNALSEIRVHWPEQHSVVSFKLLMLSLPAGSGNLLTRWFVCQMGTNVITSKTENPISFLHLTI